jgi:hypothetical protein
LCEIFFCRGGRWVLEISNKESILVDNEKDSGM